MPLGTPGEIAIKGPQVMAGYWQRPDETAKVMTADGFFRSGDIGVVDERGYFKIVDRKKDMILVSGFNVYPNEVEDVVTQMPGILECAAVGIADAKAGEAVKLVIVQEGPGRHRGRGARVLRGQPHRLQAAEDRRVPHRAAEDAGRQDPAPRAARQGLSVRDAVERRRLRADTFRAHVNASAPERAAATGTGTQRVIWAKTDAGRAEMQTRALVKERARRNLLLLIDGTKTEEMLLANLAGITAADFQELRKLDLIAPAAGAVTVGNRRRARLPTAGRRCRGPQPRRCRSTPRRSTTAQFTAALTQDDLDRPRPARLHADARGRQGRRRSRSCATSRSACSSRSRERKGEAVAAAGPAHALRRLTARAAVRAPCPS